jgi:signal transduction histidine kinase/CheY-like chemotaxis protein
MNRISNNKKYSIRAKLTLIIVVISTITLLLAASLFTLTQLREHQRTLAENLSAIAKITGGNVQAALAFEDADDAEKILSELDNDPRIIAAEIYTKDNKIFSSYYRFKEHIPVFEPPKEDGYFFETRQLHLSHTIYIEGEDELIGKIYIQASLEPLYQQLTRNISITAIIVLFSLFLSIILASRFQKLISVPILKLSDATDKVRDEKDFSVRVNRDDFLEIEHLCAGFNNMLEHIQTNEQQLLESRDLLEQRVTDRTKELEVANIELKESKELAETANKAKSQFLASMSHELRTPLNAIIGFTELILGKVGLDNTFENYINIINQSGDHLLALINDILDMAKIEAGKLEIQRSNIDLFSMLESTIAMLDIRAQNKGIDLNVEYDSDLPQFINIDGLKFRQILINLIGNAIKFTDNGEVKLIVNYQSDEKTNEIGNLFISIIDTGMGMKDEELKILFSPFTQTDSGRKQHGTGLGLNLSKSYIELMGGEITVDSNIGEGTRFDFFVRTSKAEDGEVTTSSYQKIKIDTHEKNFKILIVEDIEHNRRLLAKIIDKQNFNVQSVHNGLEAIDTYTEWNPDLILMDIQMPVMNGIEALEKIRNLPGGMDVKIIAITASGLSNNIEKITINKFDEIMYKPYREREIFNMLQRHLNIDIKFDSNIDDEYVNNSYKTDISREDLNKVFSEENLNLLLHAAIEGDINKLYQVVGSIDSEYSLIKANLAELIDDFKFESIISIISPLDKSVNQ